MQKFLKFMGILAALGIVAVIVMAALVPNLTPIPEITPTPEIFIPLDEAIPQPDITLEGVHLEIGNAALDKSFPAGCTGEAPACTLAESKNHFLSVSLSPRNLPEGQILAYKNLPAVSVAMEGGFSAPYSLTKYNNATDFDPRV